MKKILEEVDQRGDDLTDVEKASLIRLIQVGGYLKLFIGKAQRGDNISEEDLTKVLKYESNHNDLVKELSR
ncbi:MAG: hypothetical protein KDC73_02140 [Ignavibacteriae bacterium]|nr:hypothetical protein [Ignavibacteriota bacterium]MCB9244479.1 hypothetical protein [Ignavibacteriales bacterium]